MILLCFGGWHMHRSHQTDAKKRACLDIIKAYALMRVFNQHLAEQISAGL